MLDLIFEEENTIRRFSNGIICKDNYEIKK
jgi:hypothetical protein